VCVHRIAYSTRLNFLDLKRFTQRSVDHHFGNTELTTVCCTFLFAIEFCQMKRDVTVNCFTRDNREIIIKADQIYILLETTFNKRKITNILLCRIDSLLSGDSVNSGLC
jgi:hypothetical protein